MDSCRVLCALCVCVYDACCLRERLNMKTRATQRSLAHLKKNGWSVCIVEKYIKHPNMRFGRRIDAFGFGDLLACATDAETGEGMIALIQCTALSERQRHIEKILPIPEFEEWKKAGGIVLLHCWAKRGPRGKMKRWILKEESL